MARTLERWEDAEQRRRTNDPFKMALEREYIYKLKRRGMPYREICKAFDRDHDYSLGLGAVRERFIDEAAYQAQLFDDDTRRQRVVATESIDEIRFVQLELAAQAVAKGQMRVARELLKDAQDAAVESLKIWGNYGTSSGDTKQDDGGTVVKQDNFLADQISENDTYQSMVQAALDVMTEDAMKGGG